MSTKRKKHFKLLSEPASFESRSSDALTVAWMVSITTLLFCDVAIVGTHILSSRDPDAQGFRIMKELLLLMGCGVGVISLVLLPIIYRVRNVAPPMNVAVFGACLAVAPVLALIVRNWR